MSQKNPKSNDVRPSQPKETWEKPNILHMTTSSTEGAKGELGFETTGKGGTRGIS
tara:strand:- start:40 stop:204 length:165 start_codon:yes stop_codon:yes gene_type:complete